MPRANTIAVSTRLAKLELKKKILIDERNKELVNIISKHNGQVLDDQLLVGFIIFATDPENIKSPILESFRKLASIAGMSQSGKRRYNKKTKLQE